MKLNQTRLVHFLLAAIVSLAELGYLPRFARGEELLIIDADTANEIDDQYAITRLLYQTKYRLLALNSAQWLHHLGKPDSLEASQRINEKLLELAKRPEIPALRGAEFPMGKPWGGEEPQDSPAAQFIIKSARSMPEGIKLNVACIGASTNLASAIKLAPDIAQKIRAHLMGFRYDAKNRVWNKSEFNIRRDLNAADFLLNQSDLELYIMPATTCLPFKFDRDETFAKHEKRGEYGAYLTQQWMEHCPTDRSRIMWDLALIQAMLNPEMATLEKVKTPPENVQRDVFMYTDLNAAAMQDDYWRSAH